MNNIDKIRKQIFSGLQSAYCEMGTVEFNDFCKELTSTINNYPKQNSHKHGIMQAEGSDGVKEAAVGNSADGKGMSVELHECPVCKQKAGKSYLLSKLPTICQKCDHAWNRA